MPRIPRREGKKTSFGMTCGNGFATNTLEEDDELSVGRDKGIGGATDICERVK